MNEEGSPISQKWDVKPSLNWKKLSKSITLLRKARLSFSKPMV